ncbi:hypothetical protein ACLBKS_08290 [Hylemonella sp. W303a]|uniref:hypothetical protein n=1 Tax=Hylemonella sp. W303a TaxID=3389873 RepID=UPI00396B00F6
MLSLLLPPLHRVAYALPVLVQPPRVPAAERGPLILAPTVGLAVTTSQAAVSTASLAFIQTPASRLSF